MKYIGNYPEQEIVHTWADRYDYVFASNPTITVNPSVPYATWLNITTGEQFICTDNTSGSNLWTGGLGTVISNANYMITLDGSTGYIDTQQVYNSAVSHTIMIKRKRLSTTFTEGIYGKEASGEYLYFHLETGDIGRIGWYTGSSGGIAYTDNTGSAEWLTFYFSNGYHYGYQDVYNRYTRTSSGTFSGTKSNHIGHINGTTYYSNSNIYEFYLFMAELTEAEIFAIVDNDGVTKSSPERFIEYDFMDNSSAFFIRDKSGNGNDGILVNASFSPSDLV